MNREKQLVKNTAIITIGKVSTQLISFVLLPLYTALLSTEEYGVVDLLNSYVFLLLPIVTFQVEQAVFRYLIDARNDEEEKTVLITTTILSTIIQIIVFSILFIVGGVYFNNEYKYFLLFNVIATIFSSIMLQITRGLGDNKTYAVGSFITALLTVIFNIILVVGFRLGAYGMLIATAVANIIAAAYIFFKKAFKYLNIRKFEKGRIKVLWKYSIPLIPNAISWWILNVSDRTIITAVLGVGMNGIYSAASKFSTLFTHGFNIFNLTWTESAAMHIDDEDRDQFFSKITTVSMKIFFSLCIGIIAFMPFVFNILINEKFADAYYQIPILMLSSFLNVIVGLISVIYIAKKLTKEVAKTSIICAIINAVVHIALINYIGIYAASISTVISCIVMIITRYIDTKKYVNIKISFKLILSMLIMLVYLYISYYMNNIYMNIVSLVLVILYCILINRDSLQVITRVLKLKLVGKQAENKK